ADVIRLVAGAKHADHDRRDRRLVARDQFPPRRFILAARCGQQGGFIHRDASWRGPWRGGREGKGPEDSGLFHSTLDNRSSEAIPTRPHGMNATEGVSKRK